MESPHIWDMSTLLSELEKEAPGRFPDAISQQAAFDRVFESYKVKLFFLIDMTKKRELIFLDRGAKFFAEEKLTTVL